MPLRAFSPQRFYSLATGSPIDRSQAVITVDTDIPARGVRIIAPDAHGDTELVWIHGVAARAEQRERFIEEIRAGGIPTPLPNSDMSAICPRVRYHALEELHGRQQSVASLLELTEPLVAAAMRSRWASCPNCAQPLSLFHTAVELCDHLLSTQRGNDLRIELTGSIEEISSWAGENGFTASSPIQGRSSVRIDSLTCERAPLQKLEPILSSTRQLKESWLTITHGNSIEEFGWNGRCARCDLTLSPCRSSVARELIERPGTARPTHEGYRIIDGIPLAELLASPLQRALTGTMADTLFSDIQKEYLPALSLTEIPLNASTTELAPRTLASLVLIAHSRSAESKTELRLFTAPSALFSHDLLSGVKDLVERTSTTSPLVWITEAEPHSAPPPSSQVESARPVTTITIHTEPPLQIKAGRGVWSELTIPSSLNDRRMAAALYHHLSGSHHELIASEPVSAFTPHFIPLFPAKSSHSRLIAHALGVIEPLAKMFAASHQAKMLGLTARDLLLGQLRQSSMVCSACKGTGILINENAISAISEPCHTCWGSRFRSPAREITFKGRTLWEILNATISASRETLRALPKMKEVVELASLLGLTELPLGMPVTLLTTQQRRLLAIAHAMLLGTATRPSLIVVEEPWVAWSMDHRTGLEAVVAHPAFRERVSWVGVSGDQQDSQK
jgi:predicted transcriptional regulator